MTKEGLHEAVRTWVGRAKENKERRTLGTSHLVSHGLRVKVRYMEVRKGKSLGAKGRWDYLRKAG